MQIVASSAATIEATFTDQHGDEVDPSGDVTVLVVSSDGSVVVASDTPATKVGGGSGRVTASLTAEQTAQVDQLTATFSSTTGSVVEIVDIVGAVYASVATIRASDDSLSEEFYTPEVVRDRREEVEVEFESAQATGVAWVPRFAVDRLEWDGRSLIVLTRTKLRSVRWMRIYSTPSVFVTVDSDTLAAIPADEFGFIDPTGLSLPAGTRVDLGYEHGYDRPLPDIFEAFLVAVRHRLNEPDHGVDDRATAIHTQEGVMPLATPGINGAVTGIPRVDVVLQRHPHGRALIA